MKRLIVLFVLLLAGLSWIVPAKAQGSGDGNEVDINPSLTPLNHPGAVFVTVSADTPWGDGPSWSSVPPTLKICVSGAEEGDWMILVFSSPNEATLDAFAPDGREWFNNAGLDKPLTPAMKLPVENGCYKVWVLYKHLESADGIFFMGVGHKPRQPGILI